MIKTHVHDSFQSASSGLPSEQEPPDQLLPRHSLFLPRHFKLNMCARNSPLPLLDCRPTVALCSALCPLFSCKLRSQGLCLMHLYTPVPGYNKWHGTVVRKCPLSNKKTPDSPWLEQDTDETPQRLSYTQTGGPGGKGQPC